MIKKHKIEFVNVLSLLVIGCIFVYIFLDRFVAPVSGDSDVKNQLMIILGAIVSFYWGSSKGSAEKDKTIKDALNSKNNESTDTV